MMKRRKIALPAAVMRVVAILWLSVVFPISTFAAGPSVPDPAEAQEAGTKTPTSQPAKTPEGSEAPPDGLEQDVVGEGEELLLFEDMPVVISASRQETKIDWLSIPTSIVTAEDIHYSGVTNIPEILRFVPGMDVVKVDRWRYGVGIRGMHDTISDRMLTLIDGRAANDILTGGAEFFRYPVLMEDIKRIEVVRGPGGAAWGANAFNGVINIITKEPEDCLGYFGTTTWSQFGDSYSQVRWAAKEKKWSWMLSTGYEDLKSSEDALHHAPYTSYSGSPVADALMGFNSFVARDYMRNWRFNGKFIYQLSDETKVKFGSAFSEASMGDYETMGYYPTDNGRLETSRSFVRVETKLDHRSDMHIQWFTNFSRTNYPSFVRYKALENDLEAQYNLRLQKHKITVGGNARWTQLDGEQNRPQQVNVEDEPINEYWAGLFAIDRWQVTDRLVLEGQFRGDYYSGTRSDWSGRLAAMYALDEAKHHIVRVSGAKAFRTPMVTLRRGTLQTIPAGGPLFLVNLLRNPSELENEETASVEMGYTGQLTKYLTFRTNAYFQRYDKLIGFDTLPDPLGFGRFFFTPENLGGANGWGVESELELHGKPGKLSVWYAYNDLWMDHDQHIRMPYAPGHHKVGITGRLFLPHGFTLNGNYRFTSAQDELDVYPTLPISHHLDLTVSKKLFKDHGEIMVGVSDLFHHRRGPAAFIGAMTAHDTPGRMFFVRFQLTF